MKRAYSLRKNRDFQKVYRHSKARSSKNLVLFVMQRSAEKNCRIGISISKKVGGAVLRNRLKRQIKGIVRPYLHKISGDIDLIILVRPSLALLSYQEIELELTRLLSKAKIIEA